MSKNKDGSPKKKMVELERLIHVAKENLDEVTKRWEEFDNHDDMSEMEAWKVVVQFLEAWR